MSHGDGFHHVGRPAECPNGHRNTGNLFCRKVGDDRWRCSRCDEDAQRLTSARKRAGRVNGGTIGASFVDRAGKRPGPPKRKPGPKPMRRGPRGGRR